MKRRRICGQAAHLSLLLVLLNAWRVMAGVMLLIQHRYIITYEEGLHILKVVRLIAVALIISILLLPAISRAQKAPDDASFLPYLSCSFDDGLKVVDIIHLPKGAEKFRELNTLSGKRKVTRIDGYTVEFAYPETDVFVNLKVEQSSPRNYSQDKETILDAMKWMLSRAKAVDEKTLKTVTFNGIELHGFDRNVLDLGIVIGTYVFFEDKSHKVVTIYFLNQKPGKRKAQTLEEYQGLRDSFFNQYTNCVASRQ